MQDLLLGLGLVGVVAVRLWIGVAFARFLDDQPEKVRERMLRMRNWGY